MSPDVGNARIAERIDLHESLAIFRVQPTGWRLPSFEPGQFTRLGLADPEAEHCWRRAAYSIASAPGQPYFEFFVQRVAQGRLTPHLWECGEDAPLWLDPEVNGRFTLQDAPPRAHLALIATGTGIAPYMSMIRHYAGTERWQRLVVVQGVRFARDLGYREELEEASLRDPTITFVPIVSREPEGSAWTGARGRVQTLLVPGGWQRLAGLPLSPDRWHVYLCGNPQMIRDVTAFLEAQGFAPHRPRRPGQIHTESYW